MEDQSTGPALAIEPVQPSEPVDLVGVVAEPAEEEPKGPPVSALAPHVATIPGPENEAATSIAQRELSRLGFYSATRAELQARGEAAFTQMTGSGDHVTESVFKHHAMNHWGWPQLMAMAAFRACDLDMSGALGPHEFLLLLAALRHHGEGEPPLASGTLNELRMRTILLAHHMEH